VFWRVVDRDGNKFSFLFCRFKKASYFCNPQTAERNRDEETGIGHAAAEVSRRPDLVKAAEKIKNYFICRFKKFSYLCNPETNGLPQGAMPR